MNFLAFQNVKCSFHRLSVIALNVALVLLTHNSIAQLPRSITTVEVGRFASVLQLTDDQRIIVDVLYQEHLNRFEEIYVPEARAYYEEQDRRIRGARENPPTDARSYFADLEREQDRISAINEKLDRQFFEEIAAVLGRDQLPWCEHLRQSRERSILRHRTFGMVAGRVDLSTLLAAAGCYESEARREIGEILQVMESHYTEAVRRVRRVSPEVDHLYNLQVATSQAIASATDEAEQRKLHSRLVSERDRVGRAVTEAELALEAATGQIVEAIEQVLPADEQLRLHRTWLQLIYPKYYVDPASAESLFDLVETFSDLNDDQRETIRSLRFQFESQHRDLTQQMCEKYDEIMREAKRMTVESSLRVAYMQPEIIEIGEKREKLNASQIVLIRHILTDSQRERLPEWDFKSSPRPRPWDPQWDPPRPTPRRPSGNGDAD